MMEIFESTVELDENGNYVIPLDDDILDQLGWSVDDELLVQVQADGTILIERKDY